MATTSPAAKIPTFDEETDVLVIGSGAGGLTANLRAAKLGFRSIVIEKEATVGGTSIISGGCLWIPCNPVSRATGIRDSEADALKYFEQAVGDVGLASSLERRRAYVSEGPKMIEFLQQEGFLFKPTEGYPDYYPAMEGAKGKGGGRSIESQRFNARKLGEWQSKLPHVPGRNAIYTTDAFVIVRMTSSLGAFVQALWKMLPLVARLLVGQNPVTMGRGLIAQLLYLNVKQNADIRLETSLSRLIQGPGGDVVGAEMHTPQGTRIIKANRGVILAAGGYAQNYKMREQTLPDPATTEWTMVPQGDTGDAIQEGLRLGAATALLDDAWWAPMIFDPETSAPWFALVERARPHCFIVDSSGSRFMNEAQSYTDAGHDQYARNKSVKSIPAWLIMDANHRNKYMLGNLMGGKKPSKEALAAGRIFVAASLEELAGQIGVDAKGLRKTADRFNAMCETGVDEDYGKGESEYDQFFGDPNVGPNSNLGPVTKGPFYAVQIWPGDIGTKGGLLTDVSQRVLSKDMSPIPGLFAIGNTAASIMGRTYLGAGSTLGPAMAHGFIAANFLGHIESRNS